DEEVTESTLRQIARVTAECGYSDADLEIVFRREVAPAVAFNVYDMAGTWGYFDTEWLQKRILRRHGLDYWFYRLIFAPWPGWDLRNQWRRVKALLSQERERVQQQLAGGEWQRCCAREAPCLRWGP